MAGDERERGGVRAVRDGDAGVGRARERRRDAGDDLEGDAGGGKLLRFFTAASEDEWIAAFEADDDLSFLRFVDEELVDLLLRQSVLGGVLANIDDLGRH